MDLKQAGGKCLFYLCYPNNTNYENPCLVFKQEDNPLSVTGSETISGLEIITMLDSSQDPVHFAGLRSDDKHKTLLNGGKTGNKWSYAAVTLILESNGIPAVYGSSAHFTELYVIH